MTKSIPNTSTFFDLDHSNEIPVLLRKIHLGKCLDEGNWEAIRKDLNDRPVEDVDGNSIEEELLEVLNFYGVYQISSESEELSTLVTIWSSGTEDDETEDDETEDDETEDIMEIETPEVNNNDTDSRMSIMELADMIKRIVGYKGFFRFNKPDDAMSKLDLEFSDELVDKVTRVYQMYLND